MNTTQLEKAAQQFVKKYPNPDIKTHTDGTVQKLRLRKSELTEVPSSIWHFKNL